MPSPSKTATLLTTGLLAAMAVTAGCGSTSSNNQAANPTTDTAVKTVAEKAVAKVKASSSSQIVNVSSPPNQIAFAQKTLSAKAGTVTFNYSNPGQIPHNFVILDQSGSPIDPTMPVFAGGKKSIAVDLKPGTYKFICQPHQAAGMVGELKVS